jgi:hypothetical protein
MKSSVECDVEIDDLICPITLQVFRDPVVAADGRTYERAAIVQWISEHGTSPFTRQPLDVNELQTDDYLRSLAAQRRSSMVSYESAKYNVKNNDFTCPIIQHSESIDEFQGAAFLRNLIIEEQSGIVPYDYDMYFDLMVVTPQLRMTSNNVALTGTVEDRLQSWRKCRITKCGLSFLMVVFLVLVGWMYIRLHDYKYDNYHGEFLMNV